MSLSWRAMAFAAVAAVSVATFASTSSPAFADDHTTVSDYAISPADHIAARNFCLAAVHKEVEDEKLPEDRFVQLAHQCSKGEFNRVFTELGGSPTEELVASKGPDGFELLQEWEREVRSAIARAPHLELK